MFNIIGMPRTRTAWLANLFTTGDTICLHDWYGRNEYRAPIECGYSDSIYHENYEPERTVFIYREISSVIDSLKKSFTFPASMDWDLTEEALKQQERKMEACSGIHLEYTELESDKTVAEIWSLLLNNEPDMTRIRLMQNFNVTVNYTNIIDAFEVREVL